MAFPFEDLQKENILPKWRRLICDLFPQCESGIKKKGLYGCESHNKMVNMEHSY
jgi:hypothetical protein